MEKIAVGLFLRVYEALYKRDWVYGKAQPHFFNQRIGIVRFAFGAKKIGPYSFYRGFFASQVIRGEDRLLDIGCGDGFFVRHFFAEKCGSIDAVDIEPSAIQAAKKYNGDEIIQYHIMDATTHPFPKNVYDVIVWDGAIGHFPPETIGAMLKKIAAALSENGIFVGSESIGKEGHDHLTTFDTQDELGKIFRQYFTYVQLLSTTYTGDNFVRKEAYWRCSNSQTRMRESDWTNYE
ncbi:MAG: class I SAM-dependent methyltransferase [Candidatus Edwardsbacteria bacterium]|nr:class I SAM-dependent methyltransferase [Candidatus Edwardsbacteria bacterium]